MLRPPRQRVERATHREQRRMIDVQVVDFLDRRNAHADPGRLGAYLLGERCACLGIQPLGVVDTGNIRIGRKHHRCGDDRSRERTHARLVDTGDVTHAGLPQQPLEVPHRVEAQPLVALALEALFQRLVEPSHALPAIAL